MCAIFGEIDYKNDWTPNADYDEILETMKSRGPDQDGKYITENAVLLHTRLSIIDLEKGRQPMTARQHEENFTLVYNGELYNTEEIRRELIEKGYFFDSHCDTEVVLKAYMAWGDKCVDRFNGIFAFAVWEDKNKRLFLARDRIGVKPLFYSVADGKFLFASEIKTILSHPSAKHEIDTHSIAEIMLIGPGRTPGYGVFKNILELPSACCAYLTERGFNIRRYWHVTDKKHTESFEETVYHVRRLVSDAIIRQLVSDVPIGTFLSGGLDSSIITALAANHLAQKGETLKTFSVYYKDNEKYFTPGKFQPNSDNAYIEIMRKHIDCEHYSVVINTDDLVDGLFNAVDARDLPGMADVDSSLLLFCREVKKHVKVALSGECADEIFGGYPWYRDKTIRESEGFPWAQSTAWRASFLKDEFVNQIDPSDYVFSRYKNTADDTNLDFTENLSDQKNKKMINLNLTWFMQTLLDRKDRMSMYSGLEVRVPFCDYRIAEYLYSVPLEFRDHRDYEKGLLREAVKDLLPEEILWRKKSPYPKTHNPAYAKKVSEMLSDIINSPNEPLLEFVKKDQLINLLKASNQTPWYGQLMMVPQTIAYFLQTNYWLKKYNIKIF